MEPEKLLKNIFGKILQVNISGGGIPKRPILLGQLGIGGFAGDRFAHPNIHGGPDQAVLLIADETIQHLTSLGFSIYPGALGENLTTSGLSPRSWRQGQTFRVGSAKIELTWPRQPCRTLDRYGASKYGVSIQKEIYDSGVKRGKHSSDKWGSSGFYAKVVQSGEVVAGDPIVLESELA